MGLFSKFHHGPERVPSDDSASIMTEMTDYSESSHSRQDSSSERMLSSGASVMSQSSVGSSRSAYSSRKAQKGWVHDINKHNLMAKHLHRNCKQNAWIDEKSGEAVVALRTFQGEYILYPQEDPEQRFERAVKGLNIEVISFPFLTTGLYSSQFGRR
jgi:hypothetical protein